MPRRLGRGGFWRVRPSQLRRTRSGTEIRRAWQPRCFSGMFSDFSGCGYGMQRRLRCRENEVRGIAKYQSKPIPTHTLPLKARAQDARRLKNPLQGDGFQGSWLPASLQFARKFDQFFRWIANLLDQPARFIGGRRRFSRFSDCRVSERLKYGSLQRDKVIRAPTARARFQRGVQRAGWLHRSVA